MIPNSDVVRAFACGQPARASNLWTDGRSLYSYKMKIAGRTLAGVVVGDFTSPGGGYISMTTSCHVNLAKSVADTVMLPEIFTATFVEMPF